MQGRPESRNAFEVEYKKQKNKHYILFFSIYVVSNIWIDVHFSIIQVPMFWQVLEEKSIF